MSWLNYEDQSYLIGKRIQSVSLPQEDTLEFLLDNGETVVWEAGGDCCSESWFESINNMGYLKGGTIVEIVEKEISEEIQKALVITRQDSDFLYGYTLKVLVNSIGDDHCYGKRNEKVVYVDVEFRNSSNGYYGGSIQERVNHD